MLKTKKHRAKNPMFFYSLLFIPQRAPLIHDEHFHFELKLLFIFSLFLLKSLLLLLKLHLVLVVLQLSSLANTLQERCY